MGRLIIILSAVLFSLPVSAGVFETAYNSGSPVFLYLYTPNCSSCQMFESKYRGLVRSHTDYKFVKVNAGTAYGYQLMSFYEGRYVPYIVLASKKLNKTAIISPYCAMNDTCAENALKKFKS